MVKVGDKCRRTKDRGAYRPKGENEDKRGYTFVVGRSAAHGVYDTNGVFHGTGAFEVIKPDLSAAIAEVEALLAELKQQELEERLKLVVPGAKFEHKSWLYEIVAIDGPLCWCRWGSAQASQAVSKRETFLGPDYKLITD